MQKTDLFDGLLLFFRINFQLLEYDGFLLWHSLQILFLQSGFSFFGGEEIFGPEGDFHNQGGQMFTNLRLATIFVQCFPRLFSAYVSPKSELLVVFSVDYLSKKHVFFEHMVSSQTGYAFLRDWSFTI